MPTTPGKARHLLKRGKARPTWSELGVFYIQLTWEQEPNNQPLCVGVDPGSSYEGYSVVGTHETVLNLMAEAPTHVKDAVEVRRTMRRARRSRTCRRRPAHFNNRLAGKKRIPPSTRSRWEAKARIVAQLKRILPLTDAAQTLRRHSFARLEARHAGSTSKYGLSSVGGFDRRKQTISLHDYRTNKRLTQGAKAVDCQTLTWTPYRTFLVSSDSPRNGLKPLKQGASSQPSKDWVSAPKGKHL